MALRDPRFSLTVVLVPRTPWEVEPVPLPGFTADLFGDVALGRRDPIDAVLLGPYPNRVLGRQAGDVELMLSGLGETLAVTAVSRRKGELEREPPIDELRAEAVAALAAGDESVAALVERLTAESEFDVAGLIEVDACLSEGIPGDLPEGAGLRDLAGLHLHRAAGVGEGHAAWQARGWYTRHAEHVVMEQRLAVLCRGHKGRTPPLADFGASAVRWGSAARTAERRARALEAVMAEVRAATAQALGGDPPDAALAARLSRARVSLAEVVVDLQARRPGLVRAAGRILGESLEPLADGPLVEGCGRAAEMVDRLASLEGVAARWADALDRAR